MARAMAKIGVYGGTFDPIHLGHVHVAEAARAALGLDRVVLVPARESPLKRGIERAPVEDRLAMARLAIEGRSWLAVSDVEARRVGPSYTVDTLRAIRAGLADGDELYFIAGADVLAELPRWYRVDEVLSLARFCVAARPGFPLEVPDAFLGRIETVAIEPRPISASEVRRRLRAGEDASELLAPAVLRYIRARGLYCSARG
jgi:nicotinate-nucleotide adenylyltransferase